ncbi:hypothetical protein CEP54_007867 [Fusarium duplospermum]|uniref:Cell wall protein n=1 Tax=Fusarium duplospermum TaxID=1325734 RepID=A0A428PYY3_9HYPO|nr:hypothetical protein CEP54_007867 [Fusarium duplospermum]
MRFSNLLPTLGGLVAIAQASPHLLGGLGVPQISEPTSIVPSVCSLANSWVDHILFKGIAAPETETSAAINLGLNLPKAQISGDVELELVKGFLQEPRIRVGLGGVKAYIEVDISASAAVHEAIELFASPALQLEIPGLLEVEAGAAIALDLVIGVDAAIDLSTGVYISFAEDAFVEISLLTKDIVELSLDGLVAKALPLGIGADVDLSGEVALQLGLRLRTEIDFEAELEIPALEIEAGAKIAIWVSLFDYTAVLIGTENCAVSVADVIALTLGLAVELNVEIGDILDLSLAPSLTITLATAVKAENCLPDRGQPGIFLESHQDTDSSTATATSGSDSSSGSASDGPSGNSSGTSSDSATGIASGSSSDGSSVTETSDAFAQFTNTPTVGHGNVTAPHSTGDVTSTVRSTHVYTITSCAASVVNCPARYTQKVVTSTVVSTTYVCPATQSGAVPATTSTSPSKSTPVPVSTITETLTTIVPCKERTTSTFHPPTNSPPAPTVTIVDRTTVCPSTKTQSSTVISQPTSGFQVITTAVPTSEAPEVPSSAVPSSGKVVSEVPSYSEPAPVPEKTAPFPSYNGTVTVSKPASGVVVPTGSWTTPVAISTPLSTHIVVSTPTSVPIPAQPTTPVVSSGSMVHVSLALALPLVAALIL